MVGVFWLVVMVMTKIVMIIIKIKSQIPMAKKKEIHLN